MTSNKLRKKLKLSKEDEDSLTSFMKINSFMWDMRTKDYKNHAKKEEKWKELSLLLQKDVDSLKKRWKSMKDYQKTKKRKPTGTGRSSEDDEAGDMKENGMDKFQMQDANNSEIIEVQCNLNTEDQGDFVSDHPMTDYVSVMRDKNVLLKEIVQSSTDLNKILNQNIKEKSGMEKYFNAFSAEIAQLPLSLQGKCQRELQLSAMSIIHKYQDMAEETQQK